MKSFVLLLVSLAQAAAAPCPTGLYSSTGATPCTRCPRGSTTSSTGSTSSDSCTVSLAGFYYNGTAVIKCPVGTFSSSTGNVTSCTAYSCPQGSQPSGTGNTDTSNCVSSEGYYYDGSNYFACPVGTYSTSTNQTTCIPCTSERNGSTTVSTASTALSFCSVPVAGYYKPRDAAGSIAACAPGSFSPSSGATSCTSCAAGNYSSSGAAFCTACATGSTTPATGTFTSQANCTIAQAGYSITTAGIPTACVAGSNFSLGGNAPVACSACDTPSNSQYVTSTCTTSVNTGLASATTSCNAGSYMSTLYVPGSSSARGTNGVCSQCSAGSSYSSAGASSCTNCTQPSNSQYVTSTCTATANTGLATAITSCNAGYYMSTLYVAGSSSTLGTNGVCTPSPPALTNASYSVKVTVGLSGVTAAQVTTGSPAFVSLTVSIANSLGVNKDDVVIVSITDAPTSGRRLTTVGITVVYQVAVASAAAATSISTTASNSAASLTAALVAANPTFASVTASAPIVQPVQPASPPPPPPPVTAVEKLGNGVETGFCVTVTGKWDRGSPSEGKWQTIFEVDGLHGEIYSWDGDQSLWRNNSEIRLTNHNHNSLHCVYTAFLVPSDTSKYGSWPADTEKSIRFCVKPNGQPMLPYDMTSDKFFQHMKFSNVKPAEFVSTCRDVSLHADTPIYLGHNTTYEPAESDHFLDYKDPNAKDNNGKAIHMYDLEITHSAFYGCLSSLNLYTIGRSPTPFSTVPYTHLTGSMNNCTSPAR